MYGNRAQHAARSATPQGVRGGRPHLGPLRVDHDANVEAPARVDLPDPANHVAVPRVRPVAHVEARHVHALVRQHLDHLRRRGLRANGADELGAAGGAEACGSGRSKCRALPPPPGAASSASPASPPFSRSSFSTRESRTTSVAPISFLGRSCGVVLASTFLAVFTASETPCAGRVKKFPSTGGGPGTAARRQEALQAPAPRRACWNRASARPETPCSPSQGEEKATHARAAERAASGTPQRRTGSTVPSPWAPFFGVAAPARSLDPTCTNCRRETIAVGFGPPGPPGTAARGPGERSGLGEQSRAEGGAPEVAAIGDETMRSSSQGMWLQPGWTLPRNRYRERRAAAGSAGAVLSITTCEASGERGHRDGRARGAKAKPWACSFLRESVEGPCASRGSHRGR